VSLLSIVQTVCSEVGIPVPNAALTSSDPQVLQMVALANREGRELASFPAKDASWSALQKQYLFTTQYVSLSGCSTALNSNLVTVPSTTGISVGWACPGPLGSGLSASTLVLQVVNSTTLQVDQVATATATGLSLTFGQVAYSFPSDYDHAINQTYWDRQYRWQMLGPLSPQEWQVLKSGIAPTGPRRRFRVQGNQLLIDPPPTSNNILVYEYVSSGFCVPAGTTISPQSSAFQTAWALDSDIGVLSEDLMTLGLKWRWLRAKGFAYDEEFKTYTDARDRAAARDGGGARSLVMNRQFISSPLITSSQIPDAGFGVPSS
jgi:hypothetical protein